MGTTWVRSRIAGSRRKVLSACGLFIAACWVLLPAGAHTSARAGAVSDGAVRTEPLRPVDIVLWDDVLAVAGHSGSIVLIDPESRRAMERWQVAEQLSDLEPWDGQLFALDSKQNRLLLLQRQERSAPPRVVGDWPVTGSPERVAVSGDGQWLAVTCRWARQVVLFRHTAGSGEMSWERLEPIALEFAPREQLWLGQHRKLLVADAFAGKLAVIDPESHRVTHTRELRGHNLRGLALDAQRDCVLVAHQQLSDRLPTTRDQVFWGNVLSNLLLTIDIHHLLEPAAANCDYTPLAHWSVEPLGQSGHAGGDPAGVLMVERHRLVCLAGVGELAICDRPWGSFVRVQAGAGAVAVAADPERHLAYVANQYADSVSVVDYRQQQLVEQIALSDELSLTAAQRGEALFHDAHLSLDGWFSCHSCHTDGHTCGLVNDNFGDLVEGTPKRIPSLLAVRDTGPWSWLGLHPTLTSQIAQSIETTMRGRAADDQDKAQLNDLAAYLQTLEVPPSVRAARRGEAELQRGEQAAVNTGRQLFGDLGCDECHRPPRFTSPDRYDVGLADEAGNRLFNPPSLLGLSQRDRLLHDGRAESIVEVLGRFEHPDGEFAALTDQQRHALLAFLESL